jgi:inner membrane protein
MQYPLQAQLIAGEPLRVVAKQVDLRGYTLRWLLSRIDQNHSDFLLGKMEIADGKGPALTGRRDSVESYNPARYTGAGFFACTTPALRSWGRGWISWPSGAR